MAARFTSGYGGGEGASDGTGGKEYGMATCPNCEQVFVKRRNWHLYCSAGCRMRAHQLERETAIREYRLMVVSRFKEGTDVT